MYTPGRGYYCHSRQEYCESQYTFMFMGIPKVTKTNMSHMNCCIEQGNIQAFYFLFGVLCRFQHYTGHITTGRGNQYIQLFKVLYCKLPTIGKQLPMLPLKVLAINHSPQRSFYSRNTEN